MIPHKEPRVFRAIIQNAVRGKIMKYERGTLITLVFK